MPMEARTLVDDVHGAANKGTGGGKRTWLSSSRSPTTNRVVVWNWLEREDAGQDAGVIVRMTHQDMYDKSLCDVSFGMAAGSKSIGLGSSSDDQNCALEVCGGLLAKATKIAAVLPVLGLTEGRRQGGGYLSKPHIFLDGISKDGKSNSPGWRGGLLSASS